MQNTGNERSFTAVRAEPSEARDARPRPSGGAGRTERKKLSLKFGS